MSHRLRTNPLAAAIVSVLLVLLVVGVVACGSSATSTTAAPSSGTTAASTGTSAGTIATTAAGPQTLTVSAASSLKGAFTEIGKTFDAANNCTTTFNFDASGTLQKQIEGGAPVDVFASAAKKQVKALTDANLADPASVKVFASNEIVLIVPADSTLNITSFADLAKADVKRIAYGDPVVAPHGVAAEEILKKLAIFDQVKPKVVYAQNVSQALTYVTSGEVDASIVFVSEAKSAGDKVKIVATSDPSWHSAIAYPICLVTASKVKPLGQAFIDYVAGADGQAVLAKYGFLPASAATTATTTTPSS